MITQAGDLTLHLIEHKRCLSTPFHPEVTLKTTRIGQVPGKETILECDAIAHPLNWFVWERDGVMLASDRYVEWD
ncbi:hypothetical protein DPMN_115115 [Dreissena polymorpha]|uniref:Ig-like domain-containing protein n=1 Tax=Dreissena polymorpha TaxID=45954 RepID=A0A9D4KKL9_DREPO|nr:hypothetical protein DPMN_115115 [Dreissena polymorpha]